MSPSSQRAPRPPQTPPELTYPIPRQAANAFTAHKSNSPQNADLVFDRFAPDTRDSDGAKKAGFEQARQAAEKADAALLTALNARWELDARAVGAQPFTLKTDWRFITGLGRKGPLEAGFTFNRYGFPILPGSSVKGIARAYAFYQLAELLQSKDLGALDKLLNEDEENKYREEFDKQFSTATPEARTFAERFRVIFGTTGNAGGAVFLDAIPTRVPKLELDIMNPHFPKYYQGDEFPTDWQSPNPVFFLTVAKDQEFRFAVGWRGKANETLQRLAQEWLMNGLQELGAGAKTSAGYGYFKEEGAAKQNAQSAVQAAAPAQPKRPATRHTAVGKIRYESGKPSVRSEEGKRWHVDWKKLGMAALKEKTLVEIEYEEFEDGTCKVVRVTTTGE